MVDPIVGMKRLTKVLMDGGSGLNITYAETLDAMGIDRSRIRPTRMEILTFEVVGFHGTYHTILGHLCYVKFMAVPNNTYLKLRMPGPRGVITVGTFIERAYECEVECYKHATAIVASKELATIREEIIEEAPNLKWLARSFEPMEGTKEVLIDPNSSEDKVVLIGTTLSSK
ncbi:uncharacterized protein [Miscanthus floridulus]|uniref:uncharacterized protein n=1 Tax=Miscanthus floridulus TaxID=154761 RepID=UPI0034579A81